MSTRQTVNRRPGKACHLLPGEEPIDPSEFVEETELREFTTRRKKIPGQGAFVVMLEKPGELAQFCVCRMKTGDEAKKEAARLNAILRSELPFFEPPFPFCFVAPPKGELPWIGKPNDLVKTGPKSFADDEPPEYEVEDYKPKRRGRPRKNHFNDY